MSQRVDVNRQIEPPRQGADAADMIMMFMGHQDSIEIFARQTDGGQTPFRFLAGEPGVDQKAAIIRFYQRTISPASTG